MKEKPVKNSEQEESDNGLASPNSLAPQLIQSSPASFCGKSLAGPQAQRAREKMGLCGRVGRARCPDSWLNLRKFHFVI